MSKQNPTPNPVSLLEQDLYALEMRIQELVQVCAHLKKENQTLRDREYKLNQDLNALRKKNTAACSRVEAMLEKLNLSETPSPQTGLEQ